MGSLINDFYEFGCYRLDPARRLLARDGKLVPLKPKVFDTLLVLVSNAGHLVTKEALIQEVWCGTAVEEGGLAKNISILRKVLGESPDDHQYVVTVPGRGYRFVAPVTAIAAELRTGATDQAKGVYIETETISTVIPEQTAAQPAAAGPPSPRRPRLFGSLRAGIAAAAGILALGAGFAVYMHSRPVLTGRDTVLLADFVNRTGDADFDETLRQGVAVQLEQSPLINICADTLTRQTLKLMGRAPDEAVTAPIAREICQRRGWKAFITGSIVSFGNHYVITLESFNGQDGTALARGQMEADSKEHVLRTLSRAASQLRQSLGESLGSIRTYDALLERTTSSLPALQAYSLGYRASNRGSTREAIGMYRRATELDPDFAYAYAGLAVLYRNSRQWALAAQYADKAYALQDRVSQREKLVITSLYHEMVTGDLGKNIEALQLFEQIFPAAGLAHNNLEVAYVTLGKFEDAVEEGRISLQLSPNAAAPYGALGNSLVRLDRFGEAGNLYQQALARGIDSLSIHRGMYRIAFVNGDATAMEQQLKWAASHSNEHAALGWQARAAAYYGHWKRSSDYSQRAIASAAADEQPELAAEYWSESALRGAALGECGATRAADQAVTKLPNPVSLTRLALAMAMCGETGEAQQKLEELSRRYPQHTVVNWIWLPAIRAATALQQGNAKAAVELLAPAGRYERAAEFWPQYLRAQAYLNLRMGGEAAGEFMKILNHRGQDVQSVLYPLAGLGLARASVLKGDTAQANRSYTAFLELWKDADVGLQPLVKAGEERSRLR